MNWLHAALIVFILLGAYTIYLETSQSGTSFIGGVWDWFKMMGANIKSITGYAIVELDWLPEVNNNGNTTRKHG